MSGARHLQSFDGVPTIDDLRPYLTCSVEVGGAAVSLGRGAAYAAVRRGELPSLRFGNRIVIPVPKLLELVGVTTAEVA